MLPETGTPSQARFLLNLPKSFLLLGALDKIDSVKKVDESITIGKYLISKEVLDAHWFSEVSASTASPTQNVVPDVFSDGMLDAINLEELVLGHCLNHLVL